MNTMFLLMHRENREENKYMHRTLTTVEVELERLQSGIFFISLGVIRYVLKEN